MKDLIKTAIALIFIGAAYFFGQRIEDEKYSEELKALSEKIIVNKRRMFDLQDSLKIMKTEIHTLKHLHSKTEN